VTVFVEEPAEVSPLVQSSLKTSSNLPRLASITLMSGALGSVVAQNGEDCTRGIDRWTACAALPPLKCEGFGLPAKTLISEPATGISRPGNGRHNTGEWYKRKRSAWRYGLTP
jgi:hypothetical protein